MKLVQLIIVMVIGSVILVAVDSLLGIDLSHVNKISRGIHMLLYGAYGAAIVAILNKE